jgi:hypothetical protein
MKAALALATVSPDRRLILLRKLVEVATTVYMTDQQIDDPSHEEDARDVGTKRQRDAAQAGGRVIRFDGSPGSSAGPCHVCRAAEADNVEMVK